MLMTHDSKRRSCPLKIAVIGTGAMGEAHCRTIAEEVEEMNLTAVVDTDAKTARTVGDKYHVPAFTTLAEMLNTGLAEAALVATPHPLHLAMVETCLAAGLHVLCEKPLAETVSAADRMRTAADRTGRTLGVMFQRRFEPVFVKALDLIRNGSLGAIRRTLLVLPDFRSQAYYDANPWRATWNTEGGGVLINQAPHLIDIFTLLAGLPQSVRGHTGTTGMHEIEVEDQAEATLRYANGAIGYLYASTTEPKHHEIMQIIGTRGSLTFRHGQLECAYYEDCERLSIDSEEVWSRPKVRSENLTFPQIANTRLQGWLMTDFARHLTSGTELHCDAASASQSLELANAITLSSYLNQTITLPVSRPDYDALLSRLRAAEQPRRKKRNTVRQTDPGLL